MKNKDGSEVIGYSLSDGGESVATHADDKLISLISMVLLVKHQMCILLCLHPEKKKKKKHFS